MVQIAHSGVNEEKVTEILLAAQKRFGQYGYTKTAMHEIADDLGISKASLYYYFPDKVELFRAVFRREQDEYIRQLDKLTGESDDIHILIRKFIHLRITNLRKFFNLGRASQEEFKGLKIIVGDLWELFRHQELEGIKKIFQKGLGYSKTTVNNLDEIALLYADTIRGLSHLYIKSSDITMMDDNDYKYLTKKIEKFTAIYLKGIFNSA